MSTQTARSRSDSTTHRQRIRFRGVMRLGVRGEKPDFAAIDQRRRRRAFGVARGRLGRERHTPGQVAEQS